MSSAGFFVTGTDTGVGKTVATAAIAVALQRQGKRVVPFKPVQTGYGSAVSDVEFAQRAIDDDEPLDAVCPYRLRAPLAPGVAARLEAATIDIEGIAAALDALRARHDTVLVEGAGGLLVPLTQSCTMADLAARLALPLVIVARPSLGTINHTALTLEAARRRGLEVAGVVVSRFPAQPDLAERTNPAELAALGAPLLGVLPDDEGLSVEDGRLGGLRDWAGERLAPALGGTFDATAFLASLADPVA